MNQAYEPVRWGVMGTARIATKVGKAIRDAEGAELWAVASRSPARAADWARRHSAAASVDSYQALLEDEGIDAVYIPLPPSMHAEWTIRAAEHGKHVLCEKPLAISTSEAEQMAAACKEHNVQLMDATMWSHHPRTGDMLQPIQDGTLGPLRRITSGFSFDVNSYLERTVVLPSQQHPDPVTGEIKAVTLEQARAADLRMQRELGGGALLDLGWYCVRATLWAFGGLPQKVFAAARYEKDVDINLSALMWFDGDRMASFDCGFDQAWRKWFEVTGTKGSIVCDDFVNPTQSDRPRWWLHDAQANAEQHIAEPAIQEQLMIENFCRIVRSGEIDEQWPRMSVDNQRVCEALDRSARSGQIVELT